MARTTAFVEEHLPPDVAGVVMYYLIAPPKTHPADLAKYGLHEACLAADINVVLRGAASSGDFDVLQLVLDAGASDFNAALECACESGEQLMAAHLLRIGAIDVDEGMCAAIRNNYNALACMMIMRGANDWNMGFRHACWGDNEDMFNFMISKGANDWDEGLMLLCGRGYSDMVEDLVIRGANPNIGLPIACENYDSELMVTLINLGAAPNACTCSTRFHEKYDEFVGDTSGSESGSE